MVDKHCLMASHFLRKVQYFVVENKELGMEFLWSKIRLPLLKIRLPLLYKESNLPCGRDLMRYDVMMTTKQYNNLLVSYDPGVCDSETKVYKRIS